LRILTLAGNSIDEQAITRLISEHEYVLARYASVSRGVRLLEKQPTTLVLLAPDENDTTWRRAISRIQTEYGLPSVLLLPAGETTEAEGIEAGAYDCFRLKSATPKIMARCLRHLQAQQALQDKFAGQRATIDWIEKTGRLGSWERLPDGSVTWSRGIRRIFEGARGELTGDFDSVRQFVHPDDIEIFDQANKATFEHGWPLDFEYRIIIDENKVRYLHLHRRIELGPGGEIVRAFGMARDITPQKEFENYLFRRDAILQAVSAFAGRFLREADWEGGIDNALKELGKAADVTRVFIFRKSPDESGGTTISMSHEWASPLVEPMLGKPNVQDQPVSPNFDRWKAAMLRRRVITGHVREFQKSEREFFEALGARSVMIMPVFVGHEWSGLIGLAEHREEREWLPVELESLTMVADMFGSAVLRTRMEDLLREANKSAEEAKTIALEASMAKSRFLANMSHEIRTPISGILGMAEMTITTGLTREQREHMDMIRDAARSLLAIVNDVLDISKIEAEKMELKPEDFELRPEIDRLVRPFEVLAEQKNVLLRHSIDRTVPEMIHGDPDRLGQILRNLLSNALKFTERGLIELTVETAEQAEERACLLFTVSDTGEGIPEDKLDTIFDSFTQADSSIRKKHQGTGLGLTISKELVEMMDGNIGVESEVDKGTTFSFTAWFNVPAACPIAPCEEPALAPEGLHCNILLAEDNPLNQRFLTHFLTMFGHTITIAGNGIEAVRAMEREGRTFDLVLMDIQMPEMGGIEAARIIRESNGRLYDPEIPIIALTAYAMKGDKERMLKAGMDDYVSKPVDMKLLSAVIARSVAKKKDSPRWSAPKPTRAPRTHLVDFDMESLIARFDGNISLLKEILDLFLEEADDKVRKLDRGVRHKDPDELGHAFHSITNIASHVMAMDIVERSRNLERFCHQGNIEDAIAGAFELKQLFIALKELVAERAKTL